METFRTGQLLVSFPDQHPPAIKWRADGNQTIALPALDLSLESINVRQSVLNDLRCPDTDQSSLRKFHYNFTVLVVDNNNKIDSYDNRNKHIS